MRRIKLRDFFLFFLFTNRVGSSKNVVGQMEGCKVEGTIEDSVLLLTFRLTQFFGMQPIIIKKINSKAYYVRISSAIYLLNILLCAVINGVVSYAMFFKLIMPQESPGGFVGYSSYGETNDILIAIAVIPLSIVSIFNTLFGRARVRFILFCLEDIKKIKQNINKVSYEQLRTRKMRCCLVLFATFWPLILEGTETWLSGFSGISTWMCDILTIIVFLLEILFLLLVESLNSLLYAINIQLNEILIQLSFNCTTTRRIKIAREIRHLMICFVESYNILEKINSHEGFLLLCHVIIFPLHILIRCYYVLYPLINTDSYHLEPCLLICDAVNCLYYVLRPFFIIQPCHQTQEEVDETKHLVAELMCHLQSSDNDPLFDSVDTFYKQLVLSNYTFTAMGICGIGRNLLFKFFGLAITLIMVVRFQQN